MLDAENNKCVAVRPIPAKLNASASLCFNRWKIIQVRLVSADAYKKKFFRITFLSSISAGFSSLLCFILNLCKVHPRDVFLLINIIQGTYKILLFMCSTSLCLVFLYSSRTLPCLPFYFLQVKLEPHKFICK